MLNLIRNSKALRSDVEARGRRLSAKAGLILGLYFLPYDAATTYVDENGNN